MTPRRRSGQAQLAREPGWEDALADYLASVRDRPHAYGRHDCLLFVAGAVKAETGTDLARGHHRKYKSQAGSVRYLRSLGFRSAEAMIDSLLPKLAPAFAHRGDVVMGEDGIPGLCMGDHALFVSEDGLGRAPLGHWVKAWRVGEER
jgi:hypothetical protein